MISRVVNYVRERRVMLLGVGLTMVGIALTVALGFLSGANKPPSRASSALLVVLASVFQVWGAATLRTAGRADPTLARASVRRLIRMGQRASLARVAAESNFESGTHAELKKAMGAMSVELSWIGEGLIEAVEDWNEFHGAELKDLLEGRADD